jgi:hypothetical protein
MLGPMAVGWQADMMAAGRQELSDISIGYEVMFR